MIKSIIKSVVKDVAKSSVKAMGTSWSSYWNTLISATVEDAEPTHVVLTFPAAKTSLGASDFTIAGFTISSASWTGSVLTLVLSTAVAYGDTPIVTFVLIGETANVTNNVAAEAEALAFFTAASITDTTQKIALNEFVKDLKAINSVQPSFVDFDTPANSILRASYPCIGGTATTHKFNLIDPRDLDAAYRLAYTAPINHDSYGIVGGGTTGKCNTFVNALALNNDSHGMEFFINKQWQSTGYAFDMGVSVTADGQFLLYAEYYADAINNYISSKSRKNDLLKTTTQNAINNSDNQIGLHLCNRIGTAIGNFKDYRNGYLRNTSVAIASGTPDNANIHFARLESNYPCQRTYSYVGIRNAGCNASALSLYSDAIIKLQYNLGRLPNKNILGEGHSFIDNATAWTGNAGKTTLFNKVIQSLNSAQNTRIFNAIDSAIGGTTVQNMHDRKATNVDPYYISKYGMKNIIVIWSGTNNLLAGTDGVPLYAVLKDYCQDLIASGWELIVLTCTPANYAGQPADFETQRDDYNNLIRTDLSLLSNVHIIDTDLTPELTDPNNATYFFTDKLHLEVGGRNIAASLIVAVINSIS